MSVDKSFKGILEEARDMLREYADTRLEIYRLKAIRIISAIIGNFAWFMVLLGFFLLMVVLASMVLGFWLSQLTGSYVTGFALTMAFIGFLIFLLILFRKKIFIDPFVRRAIAITDHHKEKENDNER